MDLNCTLKIKKEIRLRMDMIFVCLIAALNDEYEVFLIRK